MLAAPYLNDNPYRLLGLGSAATQAELLQAAELAEKTAQIGIPPPVGLQQVFGAERLTSIREKVQALGEDPLERTVYRLFWPFDYKRLPTFTGSLADLQQADVLEPTSSFRILQLRFVITWVKYLVQPSPQRIQEVLEAFDTLCRAEAFGMFLAELLVEDGETPERAAQIGNQAPAVTLERLLMVFRRQAAQWWESGEIAAVTELVPRFSVSAFHLHFLEKILPDVIAGGDAEAARLQSRIQTFPGWMPDQPFLQATEFSKLHLLAFALQGRVPAAQGWLQVVAARMRQVVGAMRDQAIQLAEKQNQYTFALQILAHLRTFPLPEDLAQQVEETETYFRSMLKTREAESTYGSAPQGDSALSRRGKYLLGVALLAPVLLLLGAIVVAPRLMDNRDKTPPAVAATPEAVSPPESAPPESPVNDAVTAERKQLADEYEQLKANTEGGEERLDKRYSTLESAYDQINADRKHVNRYSKRAVRAYNARLDALNRSKHQYILDVQTYNKKLKRMIEIKKRLARTAGT